MLLRLGLSRQVGVLALLHRGEGHEAHATGDGAVACAVPQHGVVAEEAIDAINLPLGVHLADLFLHVRERREDKPVDECDTGV